MPAHIYEVCKALWNANHHRLLLSQGIVQISGKIFFRDNESVPFLLGIVPGATKHDAMSPCEPSGVERRAAWEKAQLAAAKLTGGTMATFPDAATVKTALDAHDVSGKCYFFNPLNVESADHELAVLLLSTIQDPNEREAMHLDCGDSGLKLLQMWGKMEDETNDMEKAYVMREYRAFLAKGYTGPLDLNNFREFKRKYEATKRTVPPKQRQDNEAEKLMYQQIFYASPEWRDKAEIWFEGDSTRPGPAAMKQGEKVSKLLSFLENKLGVKLTQDLFDGKSAATQLALSAAVDPNRSISMPAAIGAVGGAGGGAGGAAGPRTTSRP